MYDDCCQAMRPVSLGGTRPVHFPRRCFNFSKYFGDVYWGGTIWLWAVAANGCCTGLIGSDLVKWVGGFGLIAESVFLFFDLSF